MFITSPPFNLTLTSYILGFLTPDNVYWCCCCASCCVVQVHWRGLSWYNSNTLVPVSFSHRTKKTKFIQKYKAWRTRAMLNVIRLFLNFTPKIAVIPSKVIPAILPLSSKKSYQWFVTKSETSSNPLRMMSLEVG